MLFRKYHPEGLYVWDTQYMVWDGKVHVYHLQVKAPGSTRDDIESESWGHAVSDDLITWEERPTAFGPGPPGSDDDARPNTGCIIPHKNKIYLFYWIRKQGRPGGVTGLAIGDTPEHFGRYPGNPILEPDPAFFYSPSTPMRFGNWVEVRDVMVLPVPERGGFFLNIESWGGVAFLDLEQQEIYYAEPPNFSFLHTRKARLEQDREYQLRVIAWGPQIEVYLDDVLLQQFARYATKEGQLGLFVDRGQAAFSDIVAHSLNVE